MAEYFTYGTKTLTLRGQESDAATGELVPNQRVKKTVGGTRKTDTFGSHEKRWHYEAVIPESSDTENDFNDLLEFFSEDYVDMQKHEFQWTDHTLTGAGQRMVKLDGGLSWRQHATNKLLVSFNLVESNE